MEKHTPYFKVLEALQKGKGCALCTLEREAVRSYLDAFLYENVNDPRARDAWRASRGLCPVHAQLLLSLHDALALSILYKDQALLAASFLEENGDQKNLSALWAKHDECPVCRQALEIRKHYAGILSEGLKEPEMRGALVENFGLCFPHLLKTLDEVKDAGLRKELAEKMTGRLKDLADRLEQYCQDCQKNASGPVTDSPHQRAWKEAVETAVGQRGVFEAGL